MIAGKLLFQADIIDNTDTDNLPVVFTGMTGIY